MLLGATYSAKGRFQDALAEFNQFAALSPGSTMPLALLGYARGRLGERRLALQVLEQLTAASKERYTPAMHFALVHVGLGESDQALTWLEKSYEERVNRLAYLGLEAFWDPLRSDPRFADLLRRIGPP